MIINKLNVKIIIPWRASPSRIPAFNRCMHNYGKVFLPEDIILSDCGSKIFNKARSVNIALKKEFQNGLDIAIVSDADTFIGIRPLLKGVIKSSEEHKTYLPYDTFAFALESLEIIGETYDVDDSFSSGNFTPCTAVFILPKKVYQDIGGFDENFYGWGPEDQEYHYRYYLKYGERYSRIPKSTVLSIEHSRDDWYSRSQHVNNFKYLTSKYKDVDKFNSALKSIT